MSDVADGWEEDDDGDGMGGIDEEELEARQRLSRLTTRPAASATAASESQSAAARHVEPPQMDSSWADDDAGDDKPWDDIDSKGAAEVYRRVSSVG
jgi:hypothetical protein